MNQILLQSLFQVAKDDVTVGEIRAMLANQIKVPSTGEKLSHELAPAPKPSKPRAPKTSAADDSGDLLRRALRHIPTDGARTEAIRKALEAEGVDCSGLKAVLEQALSEGKLTKSGEKRATTYFRA